MGWRSDRRRRGGEPNKRLAECAYAKGVRRAGCGVAPKQGGYTYVLEMRATPTLGWPEDSKAEDKRHESDGA